MTGWTLAKLQVMHPCVPWDEPIPIESEGGAVYYGCRVCIANHGLEGSAVDKLPTTVEVWRAHFEAAHPIGKGELSEAFVQWSKVAPPGVCMRCGEPSTREQEVFVMSNDYTEVRYNVTLRTCDSCRSELEALPHHTVSPDGKDA